MHNDFKELDIVAYATARYGEPGADSYKVLPAEEEFNVKEGHNLWLKVKVPEKVLQGRQPTVQAQQVLKKKERDTVKEKEKEKKKENKSAGMREGGGRCAVSHTAVIARHEVRSGPSRCLWLAQVPMPCL